MARGDERRQVIEEFDEAVNMTLKELEEWLHTDESESARERRGRRVRRPRVGPQDRRDPRKGEVRPHRRRPRPHEEV